MTDEPLGIDRTAKLRAAFTDSDLPFRVDIVDWATVSEAFREQIRLHSTPFVGAVDVSQAEQHAETAPLWERLDVREWKDVPLGDLVDIYDGPHATPRKTRSGPVFLGISNLQSGRLDLTQTEHLSETDYQRWTRRVTPAPNDIVFSYETRLGEAALIPQGLRACLGRRMGLLRPRDGAIDARFLLYAFLGKGFQNTLRARTVHGSTVDRILLTEMADFSIYAPQSITEQRAIAHILGALDDKIELLRRMNATLESMARALFRSWFVDFDPVRAKMDGRGTGLPKEVADLFPDRLVDSELGEIPEGWTVSKLGDMIELAYGKALKAKARNATGGVPVFGSNGQIGWHDEALVERPGIVVGRKGNPGTVTLSPTEFFPIDTTFYVVPKHERDECLYFLFFALQEQDLPSVAADSAVPGLNRNLAYMNEQLKPPTSVVKCFDGCASTMYARCRQTAAESRLLVNLRGTLLPKLVSGELRVGGLETE